MASDWEGAFEVKSEAWQTSEAGQAAQERIETVCERLEHLSEDCPIDIEEIG